MSLPPVWRGDTSPRFFPTPFTEVDGQTAPALLALRDAELPRRAPYTAWRLTVPQQFARLWRHQRAAVRHESEGRWRRADYFWKLAYDQLVRVSADDDFWREVAEACGAGRSSGSADDVRRRFVNEVLIDTHSALYNGYALQSGAAAAGRAAAHFSYLRRLLDLGTLPEQQRARLVIPLAAGQLEAGETEQDYERAAAGCELLLKQRPHDERSQTRLSVLEYARTLKELSRKSVARKAESYLKAVRDGIGQQAELERRYPYNLTVHELTARLYLLEAVKLKENGTFEGALKAVDRATAYAPTLKGAEQLRDQIAWMAQAQREEAYVRAASAGGDDDAPVYLSDHMRQAPPSRSEAMSRPALSPEAERLQAAWHTARARYLWNEIGLPAGRRDELAPALWNALGSITAERPADESAVAAAWDAATSDKPELAGVERGRVLDFLAHHLLGKPPRYRDEEARGEETPLADAASRSATGSSRRKTSASRRRR